MNHTHEMEFHVSRKARERYDFSELLFALNGNIIFANFHGARLFVQKMNGKRDLLNYPEQALKTGQLVSMGLIDEILHHVAHRYREEVNAVAMEKALSTLYEKVGREKVLKTLNAFTEEFPPVEVYRRKLSIETYLESSTGDKSNLLIALEELVLLWLANMNPAFSPFMELFDDSNLKKDTAYLDVIKGLQAFFEEEPPFGPYSQALTEMLRSPAIAVPHSLAGQLEYIREHWGFLLGSYLYRLLTSLDLIKEEEKLTFLGPGPSEVYRFTGLGMEAGLELEQEQFSPDREWMPRLILMAKNIYVWLDQLSKKYARSITTLAEIPDGELETLQRQGFSGLWLIGIWERSPASQKVKQLCGNPEAVPSAYSLFDYQIATDLGGEDAYADFRDRAWRHGIRLASDMVPNHVGIYSRWVVEHPDWFVSLDQNPFPWYTYSGPDLSHDERVGIFIEDHYYTRTDAAVVFKRVDRWTGLEEYVYHGNDGTSMPWNDTAQLNYLNPEMREAMIQTILHVARKFPVIRFDAAMTLTKKHYQRLWFPQPGAGGAIPTRAEYGLKKTDFDQAMPKEFWREVVDRVAAEAPDTLLLAEAFWLLEGFFVRTLGMHRVYNSAFMNMLRDEDNAKYRSVMKNTLEFDPEILRRFVNFMNNPDERTAVDQFGKENKYFGICTMMVTLPGLPMFGHGQIEGFAEKYGMEYRKAYWDEQTDSSLIQRHEREIFPLLHNRRLFAGVENFLLYDFFDNHGNVNEDVFAYSNGYGSDRALVAYQNRNAHAAGWIRTSVAFSVKADGDGTRVLVQKSLGAGLGLDPQGNRFTIFRDHLTQLAYIRPNTELCEKGLYVELGPYHYHVFLDFREIQDNEQRHYTHLNAYLNGRGVPSIEGALREIFLQPIHQAVGNLFNAPLMRRLVDIQIACSRKEIGSIPGELLAEVKDKLLHLVWEVKNYTRGNGDEQAVAEDIVRMVKNILVLQDIRGGLPSRWANISDGIASLLTTDLDDLDFIFATAYGWSLIHGLARVTVGVQEEPEVSRCWIDEWHLGRSIGNGFVDLGFDEWTRLRALALIKIFTSNRSWFLSPETVDAYTVMASLLQDDEVRRYLQINRHMDILWFSKESFESLLFWMVHLALIKLTGDPLITEEVQTRNISAVLRTAGDLLKAFEHSECRIERALDFLRMQSTDPDTKP